MPSPPKLGTALPRIALPATTGEEICLAEMPGRSVLIVYPWTGRPGHPNPPNWDDIEGAHGSTPELEGFRDLSLDFVALNVGSFGLSGQATGWQREMALRLRLPFPILSDAEGRLARAVALPQFRNRWRELPEKTHARPLVRHHRSHMLSGA